MAYTPQPVEPMDISEDSGCLTGSFQNSTIPFESTPVNFTPATSRKRKVSYSSHSKLENISETYATPQFSSTLNESLLNNIEKISITPNYYVERKELQFEQKLMSKCQKPNTGNTKTQSAPATPIKQIKAEAEKSHSVKSNDSPYKEVLDIVYPTIVPRKSVTPQKYSSGVKRYCSPAKKRLFDASCMRVDPIRHFKGNSLIISNILSYLDDRDLCRMKMVSRSWSNAVDSDKKAAERCKIYLEGCKINKENRFLVSPDSPPSPESPPVSPGSQKFHRFTKLAQTLCPGQSLRHCPSCTQPAVVEKDIGQCQNLNCRYIFCLNCDSFSSTGPENFHNKCDKSQLALPKAKQKPTDRFELSDLSNNSFLGISKTDSSGYVSGTDSPILKVKRNLRKSFGEKPMVLANSNSSVVSIVRKKKVRASVIPVISCGEAIENIEVMDAPSPPKIRHTSCSKQTKKNLRRLLI